MGGTIFFIQSSNLPVGVHCIFFPVEGFENGSTVDVSVQIGGVDGQGRIQVFKRFIVFLLEV